MDRRKAKKQSKAIAKQFGGIKAVKLSRRAMKKSGEATSKLFRKTTNWL